MSELNSISDNSAHDEPVTKLPPPETSKSSESKKLDISAPKMIENSASAVIDNSAPTRTGALVNENRFGKS